MTRPYRMKARASRQEDTRRRIVAAAARLHRTLGPDRTSISAIARLAGVEWPTVVRHFPDRASLVLACLVPSFEQTPPPSPAPWAEIVDPEARLATALAAMYPYYRRNRVFLRVIHDETNTEFAAVHASMRPMLAHMHGILAEGWSVPEPARLRLMQAIRHAFSFWAWVSLADLGFADDRAAELMLDMVRGMVHSLQPD